MENQENLRILQGQPASGLRKSSKILIRDVCELRQLLQDPHSFQDAAGGTPHKSTFSHFHEIMGCGIILNVKCLIWPGPAGCTE